MLLENNLVEKKTEKMSTGQYGNFRKIRKLGFILLVIIIFGSYTFAASNNDSTFFTGLKNVHEIYSVICPKEDSGFTVVLFTESFRNINSYEFYRMNEKCKLMGSHIETEVQIGIDQDPNKRKLIYLMLGLTSNEKNQDVLFVRYSNPRKSINSYKLYKTEKVNDVINVIDSATVFKPK